MKIFYGKISTECLYIYTFSFQGTRLLFLYQNFYDNIIQMSLIIIAHSVVRITIFVSKFFASSVRGNKKIISNNENFLKLKFIMQHMQSS